jgi:hypothetical protein
MSRISSFYKYQMPIECIVKDTGSRSKQEQSTDMI